MVKRAEFKIIEYPDRFGVVDSITGEVFHYYHKPAYNLARAKKRLAECNVDPTEAWKREYMKREAFYKRNANYCKTNGNFQKANELSLKAQEMADKLKEINGTN